MHKCWFEELSSEALFSRQDAKFEALGLAPTHRCVMQVDEGFFTAFGPTQLKMQLDDTKELVVPRRHALSFKGLDASAVFRLAAVLAVLGVMVPVFLMPQLRALGDVSNALCGMSA